MSNRTVTFFEKISKNNVRIKRAISRPAYAKS
jgi:hypothetical protein